MYSLLSTIFTGFMIFYRAVVAVGSVDTSDEGKTNVVPFRRK